MNAKHCFTIAFAVAALFGAPSSSEEVHSLLAKGKTTYQQLCAKCHGKDLVNPGTSSFDLRKFPTDQKKRFFKSVNDGRGDMPAWRDVLYPGELDALWVYVATRAGKQPFPDEAAALPDKGFRAALLSEDKLTVCLARNNGALSGRRSGGGSGLDYRLVEAIAAKLALKLSVVWFESEAEEESDPVRETYALLSRPLCDLTASHPLYEGAFGSPPATRATLPRWDDMPVTEERIWADLLPVAVSEPYMRAEIGLVAGPAFEGEVRTLADLTGVTLGLQQGTLSGAIVQYQAPLAVINRARTFNPGPSFLWEIEKGNADIAIVDVPAFDFHRKQNKLTRLRLLDWRHPLGFNIGLAVLEEHAGLRAAVNVALQTLMASGSVRQMAEEEGVTWAPPVPPFVQPRITKTTLLPGD